jgi:hypothetical protein
VLNQLLLWRNFTGHSILGHMRTGSWRWAARRCCGSFPLRLNRTASTGKSFQTHRVSFSFFLLHHPVSWLFFFFFQTEQFV